MLGLPPALSSGVGGDDYFHAQRLPHGFPQVSGCTLYRSIERSCTACTPRHEHAGVPPRTAASLRQLRKAAGACMMACANTCKPWPCTAVSRCPDSALRCSKTSSDRCNAHSAPPAAPPCPTPSSLRSGCRTSTPSRATWCTQVCAHLYPAWRRARGVVMAAPGWPGSLHAALLCEPGSPEPWQLLGWVLGSKGRGVIGKAFSLGSAHTACLMMLPRLDPRLWLQTTAPPLWRTTPFPWEARGCSW